MRQQNRDFRKAETKYVLDRWQRMQAISIIGVGSVGKSNFLQHITSLSVLEPLQSETHQKIIPLVLDANLLGSLSSNEAYQCWAGFELIVHRLYLAAYPFDILENDATLFFETYARMQDGSNPNYTYMGLRYLELALQFFFRRGVKIVLVLDEFEVFLKYLPLRFFLNLRGLRDTQKNLFTFMTFTREPLPRLLNRYNLSLLEYEPFIELFNDHVFYLGPYGVRDATAMARSILPNTHHASLGELVTNTGGFAGLIRATAKIIAQSQTSMSLAEVMQDRAIQTECATILSAIDDDERTVLNVALGKLPYNDVQHRAAVNLLVQKRLLSWDVTSYTIEIQPPLLRVYLEQG